MLCLIMDKKKSVSCGLLRRWGYLISVQSLRREKLLRIFKLNTGQDDDGIMFMDDYLDQVGSIDCD